MVSERKHKDVECGKVYRIYDVREPGVTLYVGSTIKPVSLRYANHMIMLQSKLRTRNDAMYDYILQEGADNFRWELLRQLDNTTRQCMHQSEQYYMDQLKPRFNKKRAYISKEQYRADQYAKLVCACGSVIMNKNSSTHKKSNKHQAYEARIALKGLRI